jgi:hypothetical protein
MFNILIHKGNATQNSKEIPSYPSQDGYHQESKTTTNASKDAGGKEPSYTVCANVN